MEYMCDIGYLGKRADMKILCSGECCDLVF